MSARDSEPRWRKWHRHEKLSQINRKLDLYKISFKSRIY